MPDGEVGHGWTRQRKLCLRVVMELSKEWTCSWNKGLSVRVARKVWGIVKDQ